MERDGWRARAACRGVDPELFFPEVGETQLIQSARQVCDGCPVRTACLDYALTTRERFGVWAGTTERERQGLRRRRRRGAA